MYGSSMPEPDHEGAIDRELDTPVYEQLAAILRDQIDSGAIPPRRPLPSIRTLCETYGVARATAVKAVGVLAAEGRVRMVRGRGWFVKPEG
jgi:GntR family transcriptional regulator